MKLTQRIRQHFCRHEDDPRNRNEIMPFDGYIFQCPKCKGHVAYLYHWNEYTDISEEERDIFIEEGAKLWALVWNREENEDGY